MTTDTNVLGDVFVPENDTITFNATLKSLPSMTVTGRVVVNGTVIIDARSVVNMTGPYNLNVFKFTGPRPNISDDDISILVGECLVVKNFQSQIAGDLYVVRVDVIEDDAPGCATSPPPAVVDEFPVIPVAVGASVGFCLLVTVIVVIVVVVCRRRRNKQALDENDAHASDFAARSTLTPQRDTRVPIQLHELRESPHTYEQTDDPLGNGTSSLPHASSVYNVVSAADAAMMAPDGIYDTVGSNRQETLQYHRVGRGGAGNAASGANGNQTGTYDSVSGMTNARDANNEYDSARFDGPEGNYHSVAVHNQQGDYHSAAM